KRLPPWDEEATRGSTQVFAFEQVDGHQPRSLFWSLTTDHSSALWCANNGALPWSASGPPNERGRSPPGSPVVFACGAPRDLHYFPLAEGRLTRLLVRINTLCCVWRNYSATARARARLALERTVRCLARPQA